MEKLIVGNLKNYMSANDIAKYLKQVDELKDVVICPSNIFIPYFLKKKFDVGIQNIYLDKTCTGEITAKQAKSLGISYTIIGHSERRINFNETNIEINEKIKEAINNNLKVILCIGETLEEKGNNQTLEILEKQIKECLDNINMNNVIIAYEPIWAIGTNIIPTINEIEENIRKIKEIINEDVKVLYGGSVNSNNISDIIKVTDGVLIGKASTDINEFLKIIEVVKS